MQTRPDRQKGINCIYSKTVENNIRVTCESCTKTMINHKSAKRFSPLTKSSEPTLKPTANEERMHLYTLSGLEEQYNNNNKKRTLRWMEGIHVNAAPTLMMLQRTTCTSASPPSLPGSPTRLLCRPVTGWMCIGRRQGELRESESGGRTDRVAGV